MKKRGARATLEFSKVSNLIETITVALAHAGSLYDISGQHRKKCRAQENYEQKKMIFRKNVIF